MGWGTQEGINMGDGVSEWTLASINVDHTLKDAMNRPYPLPTTQERASFKFQSRKQCANNALLKKWSK